MKNDHIDTLIKYKIHSSTLDLFLSFFRSVMKHERYTYVRDAIIYYVELLYGDNGASSIMKAKVLKCERN